MSGLSTELPCVITTDIRHGNLHVRLRGAISAASLREMTAVMVNAYAGEGNIFIHTETVSAVEPRANRLFTGLLRGSGLPNDRIYLMGHHGESLCHDQGKVIHTPEKKHRCRGKCTDCACKKAA